MLPRTLKQPGTLIVSPIPHRFDAYSLLVSTENKLSPRFIVGGLIAFTLVFSAWCGWNALAENISLQHSTEDGKAGIIYRMNFYLLGSSGLVVVALRYFLGPVLGPVSRAVLSLGLVLSFISVWELLQTFIRQCCAPEVDGIGYRTQNMTNVYSVIFGVALICGIAFEYNTKHDLIGNHLLF